MRLSDKRGRPLAINIVSMIDVIFSILAFFIISSLFLTRSEGLPVNLPKAATAELQRQAQITITIEPDGAIALNRKPVELEQLEAAIQPLLEPDARNILVLNADEKVFHGQVVAVMDRLRRIEGAALAIATQPPSEEP
ncbi:MAG: biopolymer transporter ExbD [Cyanobacteria bacterium J06641_5]